MAAEVDRIVVGRVLLVATRRLSTGSAPSTRPSTRPTVSPPPSAPDRTGPSQAADPDDDGVEHHSGVTSEPGHHDDLSPDGEVDRQPLGEFLAQLAARLPAPGAGATAAIEAALAASLVAMVGRFTTGDRFGHQDVVREVIARADAERDACLAAAAADEVAFSAVTDAYGLPSDTADEEAERDRAISAAQQTATEPPRDVLRSADRLVGLAERLLPIANSNLLSDVAAATAAARAAAATARLAIEVNLPGVRDVLVRTELSTLVASVDDLVRRADAVEADVRCRLPS